MYNSRMMDRKLDFTIKSKILSHPGNVRENNEDFAAFFEPTKPEDLLASGCLYIVADGVGGSAQGERASKYAAEKVLYEYYRQTEDDPGQRLRKVMAWANRDLFNYAESAGIYQRIATTLVAVVIRNGEMIIANVGDSRAYLLRDNEAVQLTTDHTMVNEMVKSGAMSEEEARESLDTGIITRSLGGRAEVLVDVFKPIALQTGDRLLLCTDGLTRYTSPKDLISLTEDKSPEQAAENLVDLAINAGGVDNITVLIIDLESGSDRSTIPLTESQVVKRLPLPVPELEPIDEHSVDSTQPLESQRSSEQTAGTAIAAASIVSQVDQSATAKVTTRLPQTTQESTNRRIRVSTTTAETQSPSQDQLISSGATTKKVAASPAKSRRRPLRRFLTFILLLLVVVCVALGGLAFASWYTQGNILAWMPFILGTPTLDNAAVETSIVQTVASLPTDIPATSPAVILEPTLDLTLIPAPALIASVTLEQLLPTVLPPTQAIITQIPTSSPATDTFVCVRQVQASDGGLSGVVGLARFNQGGPFFRLTCTSEIGSNSLVCINRAEILAPEYRVIIGEWVELSAVNSAPNCINENAIWAIYQP